LFTDLFAEAGDDAAGGHTAFPLATPDGDAAGGAVPAADAEKARVLRWLTGGASREGDYCAAAPLRVAPRRGQALLWHN
jgi:hypothetical protein